MEMHRIHLMAISVLPKVKLNQNKTKLKPKAATFNVGSEKREKKNILVHMTISILVVYNMHTHVSSAMCTVQNERSVFFFLQNRNLNKINVVVAQPTNNKI